jgi:hypothetical protein
VSRRSLVRADSFANGVFFSEEGIEGVEGMGMVAYRGRPFRDLMNANYYPLENMKKSVKKLKASANIHLPTLEYGQYQLILTPKSKWPQGSAKYWHKEKGRARVDLEAQPNHTPLSMDEPDVVPLTRCALLDACVRKCFNSEPPIPMKANIITHEATDPGANTHEIRLEWEYEGDSKTPTLLHLTMVCPHKPAHDARANDSRTADAGEGLSLG